MSAELNRFFRSLMPSVQRLEPTGWSIAPGNSVSGSGPVKGVFSATGEGGDFTATHFNRPDKYKFRYVVGGAGAGLSFPWPDAQWFPTFMNSGNFGTVMRVPPYAPPAYSPSGGYYENGPPTGFEGGTLMLGLGGIAGMSAHAATIMFMGHEKPPKTWQAALKRTLLDTGMRAFGPLGQFASVIKDFHYVTTVWCNGMSSPQLSGGVTVKFGNIWR